MSAIKTYALKVRRFSRAARLLLLAGILFSLGWAISAVLFPLYLIALGNREDFIGSMSSVAGIACGLAAIPAGVLLDRTSRKLTMIWASVASGVFALAQIAFPSRAVLLGANAITGGLGAVFLVVQSPFFMDNSTPDERSYLFGLSSASMTVTSILGSMLAGRLPGLAAFALGLGAESILAFKYALLAGLMFQGLGMVPVLFIHEARDRARGSADANSSQGPALSWSVLPSRRTIEKICLVNMLIGFGTGLGLPFVNVLFKLRLGLSTETIGVLTAVQNAAITLSILSYPFVERKLGRRVFISAAQVISSVFMLVMGLPVPVPVVVVAFFIRGSLANMAHPARQKFSMETVTQAERARTSSFEQFFWQILFGAGASLGGYLIRYHGYTPAFSLAAVFFALAGLVYGFGFKEEERRLKEA